MANALIQSASDAPVFGSTPRGRTLSTRSTSMSLTNATVHLKCLQEAIGEARKSLDEGGIPIGCVLVHSVEGIVGRGHNQRIQLGSVIHHAEMNCLENVGRKPASFYRDCTLYTTLSPCAMCSGAVLLYGIPVVVIGENKTFQGDEQHLKNNGVALEHMKSKECEDMMKRFIETNPQLWYEDIGQVDNKEKRTQSRT
ncbi:unnamed protein product [Didymodactylos carnosus]|uniref:Cytosine deaminase n=2 Tax=Didymodactylos carnosus TaxID=1234261 RepID=A0A814N5E3_9BILA|nr:unnamed protein product [Didymodactylos carnosus]CAF3854340.1 unnamed protein product [Didymodactylos carnosus]